MKTKNQINLYELLTGHEVEAQYKIPIATQKKWRWMKYHGMEAYNGFPFIKIGRLVRYRRMELEKWLSAPVKQSDVRAVGRDSEVRIKPEQLRLFDRK